MSVQAIGQPVRREEDLPLLKAKGRYVADVREPNEVKKPCSLIFSSASGMVLASSNGCGGNASSRPPGSLMEVTPVDTCCAIASIIVPTGLRNQRKKMMTTIGH